MTITEFLLARIAEDEATASERIDREVSLMRRDGLPDTTRDNLHASWRRPLAECEAKRRIVEQAWKLEFEIDGEWGSGRSIEEMKADGVRPAIITALASVYADHPDFQDEWRTA